MAKHTPGPWAHATDMGQVGSVEFADGTVIAQAQQLPGDPLHEQRNANARLLAAAPELLDALRKLRNEVSSVHIEAIRGALGNTNAECLVLRVLNAEAAITKAEGSAS
ncbi:hypothetical protein D9M72_314790 [compost metagenome]